jgi:hypothetical protein
MSIAIRETAPAASKQTSRMPAVTVKGRFSENSASDIGQPASRIVTEADLPSRLGWNGIKGTFGLEGQSPYCPSR